MRDTAAGDAFDIAPALRVRRFLDSLGVAYEVLHCTPELSDTAVFCDHYGYDLDNSANTLIVTSKTGVKQYVACVLLGSTRLDVNRIVRKRMGARRLSFAAPEETRELTGMELGGVTPLALPDDVPLWVDSQVMQRPYVILGGGSRDCKIKAAPSLFLSTPNTTVVEGLAYPPYSADFNNN
ncbi:MAG: YbaK/EbsC family protein [Gammaproteobacteria bacterium]